MRNKLQILFLFLLIISTDTVLGKSGNKTKTYSVSYKKHNVFKGKHDGDRIRRSLNNEGTPFWPKKQIDDYNYVPKYKYELETDKILKDDEKLVKEQPFWGNRGRRDSSSVENVFNQDYPEYYDKSCKHCSDIQIPDDYKNIKDRREDFISPFWGSRGRRNSNEIKDLSGPFWGNRGKKEEKEPFWGNRGRRTEESPFWGNRGRREDEPFWGNRGRRDNVEPFWGNRGRREDQEPFWGTRGRRKENEPFWGNRGRRKDFDWTNRNRKENLKESILNAINDVEDDIESLSRLKRGNLVPNPFWVNRKRESKLKLLFGSPFKTKILLPKSGRYSKTSEPGTVLDNRMFVEEPNYILVERSSRSSSEDDPYYISRGKKNYYTYNTKAVRDRRGAIEEIVKSVRNDPYYIARGKKDILKIDNSSVLHNELDRAKNLICSAIDMLMIKESDKVKREINDNDRDRRTILKKLAAQLQMDPYFVSRGKRSEKLDDDDLQEFITNIAEKCNTIV